MMLRVIIESPYAGEVSRNVQYAERAMRHSLGLGEAPYLSHLLYTRVYDDTVPELRSAGITAGFAWWELADKIIFYDDYGFSNGMRAAWERAQAFDKAIEIRSIGLNPEQRQ